MKDKLQLRDYRFIAICLALAAAATWFSFGNFYRAFPEASIDFRVDRGQAGQRASVFLTRLGYRLDGYRDVSAFRYDDDAKTFLEREAGLERANRIMAARLHLWRWAHRWFQPQRKEEFRASVATSGELVGFEHVIAEDAPRGAISAGEARAGAENFLRTAMGRDPASLDFIEAGEQERPHRVDRVFTWKVRGFELHEATHRVEVTMLGDEVGACHDYLKIPEQWTRDYQRLRSRNETAQNVDAALMLALVVGLIVVIVQRVRGQDIRWRRAAWVAGIGLVLAFGAQLNQFPLAEFDYPTTDSFASFASRQVFQAVLAALGAGGLLFVLAAGAEPVYRQAFGGQVSLGNLFGPRSLRTRRFFLGAILGATLCTIFIAYQTAFYIVAYRHGAWSPADVPYDNMLNTRFPWLAVAFGGYFPAVSEEFLFRMFAIPFLRKLVRWMPLAVVLAAFLWGFGHAGYPQQPFYIRGVEVGVGGVALGIVMLRWGILPTLVWHYSVDAMYSAMLLVRSHNLYMRLSGAATAGLVVLPIAVALVAYFRRGGFEPVTGLLNADEPAPVEPLPAAAAPSAAEAAGYRPLSRNVLLAAAALLLAGLASLAIPVARFGDSPVYKLTAGQARAAADRFLRSQQLDPARFRTVTSPDVHWDDADSLAAKFFLEHEPVATASARFENDRPIQHWVTRYYRPLDQEEMLVSVHPETGRPLGFQHVIPEDRPGADLGDDEARAIAQKFAASQGFDTGAMDLNESSSDKKKARRDHTLVWQARHGDPRNLAEVRFRLEVSIAGDRVSAWRVYWHVPDSYARARSRKNWIAIALGILRIGVPVALIVAGIWLLVDNIRRGLVAWRPVMRVALPATALVAVSSLLMLGQSYRNYPTSVSLQVFQAMTATGLVIAVIGAFLGLGAAVALVTSSFPECLGVFRRSARRLLGPDALAALAAAVGLALLVTRAMALLQDRFHAQALFDPAAPSWIVSAAPAASALAGALSSTLLRSAALAAIVLLVRRWFRFWPAIAMLLAFAVLPEEVRTPGEFALSYGAGLAAVAAAALFCFRFARGNPLAYALALWTVALRGPLTELFSNPAHGLPAQGAIVAAVLAASLCFAAAPRVLDRRNQAEPR
ncbi:MAG: CPBP family intramembrane glutamic endopeptidase [Bryobacteraceae bacterium]